MGRTKKLPKRIHKNKKRSCWSGYVGFLLSGLVWFWFQLLDEDIVQHVKYNGKFNVLCSRIWLLQACLSFFPSFRLSGSVDAAPFRIFLFAPCSAVQQERSVGTVHLTMAFGLVAYRPSPLQEISLPVCWVVAP